MSFKSLSCYQDECNGLSNGPAWMRSKRASVLDAGGQWLRRLRGSTRSLPVCRRAQFAYVVWMAENGAMLRILCSVLALALVSGSLESVADLEIALAGDSDVAHEVHGEQHPDSESPEDACGEAAQHFCHCAAHALAAIMSGDATIVPASHRLDPISTSLHGAARLPPLLRPPNLG